MNQNSNLDFTEIQVTHPQPNSNDIHNTFSLDTVTTMSNSPPIAPLKLTRIQSQKSKCSLSVNNNTVIKDNTPKSSFIQLSPTGPCICKISYEIIPKNNYVSRMKLLLDDV